MVWHRITVLRIFLEKKRPRMSVGAWHCHAPAKGKQGKLFPGNPLAIGLTVLGLILGIPVIGVADSTRSSVDDSTPIQVARMRQRRDRSGQQGRFLQELNLTPDQTRRITAIRSKYKAELQQQRQATQQAQKQLRDLMVSSASAGQVRQQFQQVQTLRRQLSETQFNSLLEVREVLTVEQRRKFAELMQNRRDQLDF